MQTQNIIERAYQLARDSSIEEIRKTLRKEGYSNVDAHLGGASIKADLKRQFVGCLPLPLAPEPPADLVAGCGDQVRQRRLIQFGAGAEFHVAHALAGAFEEAS